ncbi:MAG: hypothetical protein HXY44_17755 [Syntrophaceae bacterium]|nr:hypothetical protein [Syntrophaceae bacterium]
MKNKLLFSVFIMISFFLLEQKGVFPQPKSEGPPEIKLGEINFRMRGVGSAPTQARMLEIQIEVLNRSPKWTAPAHSIRVLVTPKEIRFPEEASQTQWPLNPEEVSLNLPLPPASGRTLLIGLALPEKKPESITFEIQINPPDGEKKATKWEWSGN